MTMILIFSRIESGVIYSAAAVFLAITTVVDNRVYYIGTAATQQLVVSLEDFSCDRSRLTDLAHRT